MKYRLTLNGKNTIELSTDEIADLDIVQLRNDRYHIIHDNKSLEVKVLESDQACKKLTLEIGGRLYEVGIEDKLDMLIEKLGLNVSSDEQVSELVAPMPGLIVDTMVQAGDTVENGDHLIILEAMKMENVIKSSGSGTIAAVEVTKGDSVDKGQILIRFE